MFDAKRFYRKLETLFHAIDTASGGETLVRTVLHDVVTVLGEEFRISCGVLFGRDGGWYRPLDSLGLSFTDRIPVADEAISLIIQHGIFIFGPDTPAPPQGWEGPCLGVGLGADTPYVMLFGLSDGWVREQLEFAFNTLRTYVNQRLQWERFRRDLLEARVVQTSLLPKSPPRLRGFRSAALCIPAEIVGGDFFDWQPLSPDSIVVAVGDASGHGIPAALQVRDVVTGLRMGVSMEFRLTTIVSRLNQVIHASDLSSRFVSLFLGELETNGDLLFVNAGHVPPLVVRSNGVESLPSTGMVLGPSPHVRHRRGHTRLYPGDLLVLYSDGLTERSGAGGEQFGERELPRLLVQMRTHDPEEIATTVVESAYRFGVGPWGDDVTIVVLQRASEP